MAKEGIRISGLDLYAGMADSQYLGVADIRNLDITSTPGVIKVAPRLIKESANTVTGLIKHWAVNPATGTVYAVDDNGQAYKRTAGTWSTISGYTGASVKGCAVFKDYFYVGGNSGSNTVVQKYGPLSGTPSWSSAIINTGNTTTENTPMLVSPADILYIGTNNYVAKTDGSTITEAVLVVPSKFSIISLEQVGTKVYAGVAQANGSTVSLIFPWDRVNVNPDIPIPVNGAGIKQMKAMGNLLYVHSGLGGTINVTNGASAEEIKHLNAFNKSPLASFSVNPGAIDIMNGGLLIGIGKTATAGDQSPVGVFYYKNKGGKYKSWQYFIPSHDLDGGANQVCQIGAVMAVNDNSFIVSWYDGSNYGVDLFNTSRLYDGYTAYFISAMYQVNEVLEKGASYRVEFMFAKPLQESEGIKIEYRELANDSWTTLGTWDYATHGASSSGYFPFGYSKERVQFKVSLTTNSSLSTSPELLSVSVVK